MYSTIASSFEQLRNNLISTMSCDPQILCHVTFLFQIMRLFALYRQAEMHRKALIVQKRYLQCQVDAFFQTQQSALLLMADMGAPVNLNCQSSSSKYPRAYARFKAVGRAVIATFRFRYILRRKMHHLKSQINMLQRLAQKSSPLHARGVPSTSTASIPKSEENFPHRASFSEDAINSRQPSPTGLSTGIQTVLSGYPASIRQPPTSGALSQTGGVPLSSSLQSYPSLLSASPQQYQREISSTKSDSSSQLHSSQRVAGCSSKTDFSHSPQAVKPLHQRQEIHPPQIHGTKMSKPPNVSPSLTTPTCRNGFTSTTTVSSSQNRKLCRLNYQPDLTLILPRILSSLLTSRVWSD